MIQKILALSAVSVVLSACNPIEGTIQVLKSFTVQTMEERNCGTGELDACRPTSVTIPAGDHRFSLVMKHSAATLNISAGSISASTDIQIPKGKSIPDNGTLVLTAQEAGQPFNAVLNVRTEITESGVERREESCSVTVREERCMRDPQGRVVRCEIVSVELPGARQVEFFYRYTNKYMEGKLTAARDMNDLIANLSGTSRDQDKIYTYQGQCFAYHRHHSIF